MISTGAFQPISRRTMISCHGRSLNGTPAKRSSVRVNQVGQRSTTLSALAWSNQAPGTAAALSHAFRAHP
jgi:hypothetical protein